MKNHWGSVPLVWPEDISMKNFLTVADVDEPCLWRVLSSRVYEKQTEQAVESTPVKHHYSTVLLRLLLLGSCSGVFFHGRLRAIR